MKTFAGWLCLAACAASLGVAGCSTETGEDTESTEEGLTSTLRCESNDYRYRTCDVWGGGRIRDVRVVRQLSSSPCEYNRSWGYQDDYVWVDRGCRADFEVRTWGGGGGGAEIIIYEHDNFGGESRRLRGATPNFDNIGFNDRVSSIIVRRGTWELCRHANFSGVCFTYEPGEYRSVWANDAFSSARPR